MKRPLVLSFWCSLLVFRFAATGATYRLEEVVPVVLARNPDLAAARLVIAEAEGRWVQSGRLSNPELEIELKPQVNLGGLGAQGNIAAGFSQRFPLTARLRLEREVSRSALAVARAEVRDAERRAAAQALTAAIELLCLESQRALKERQLSNSLELARVAGKSATLGEGSGVEAAQFELEAQELSTQRIQLEADRSEWIGLLRPLLGLEAPETVEIGGDLGPAELPEGSGTFPVDRRPDYQAALARRETADRALALARANRWEDVGVGVFGEMQRQEDDPLGVVDDNFVGLRLSLPLPFWNRNQGRILESEAALKRAERESEALQIRIRSEMDSAWRQMEAGARLDGEVTRTLLPNALKLEARLEGLRAEGQASLTEVLRARERRFRVESIRVDARRNFHRARVRLDAATGMIVPDTASR
ncbi:MAG: TolC family protein [Verrucomicrobia bacterium]|nr:TolC family protein [Verrucomicrobiota bacterium]